MRTSYYRLENKILDLSSIRDITLSEHENVLYVSYKTGDIRTEVIKFSNRAAVEKAFADLYCALATGW